LENSLNRKILVKNGYIDYFLFFREWIEAIIGGATLVRRKIKSLLNDVFSP